MPGASAGWLNAKRVGFKAADCTRGQTGHPEIASEMALDTGRLQLSAGARMLQPQSGRVQKALGSSLVLTDMLTLRWQ